MQLLDALGLEQGAGLEFGGAAPAVVSLTGGGGKTSTLIGLLSEAATRRLRTVITTTTHLSLAQVQRVAATGAPVVEVAPTTRSADFPWQALNDALAAHGRCLLVGPAAEGKVAGIGPELVDLLAKQAGELGLGLIGVEADGSRTLPIKAPAAHEPVVPQSTTLLVPVVGLDAVGALIRPGVVHRPELLCALLNVAPDTRLTPEHVAHLLLHPEGGAKGKPSQARLLPILNKAEAPERLALGRRIAQTLAHADLACLLTAFERVPGRPVQGGPVRERWGPWAVVILAAGRAQRMGRAKQLLKIDGESLIARAVRTAFAANPARVVVVTGAYQAEVEAALAQAVDEHAGRLQLVHNAAFEQGQATSIQAGLAALPQSCEAALFMPVDQPFVPPLLLRRLVQAWRAGAPLAGPVIEGKLRGAPAIFARALWPELAAVEGDMGGRAVVQAYAQQAAGIDAQPGWLVDLDTPADLVNEISSGRL
jgi:molybdenum cofactor cytidylyltransferase